MDEIPFGDFPISLHRKNVIDFVGGWHRGLVQIVDTLEDAHAPKVADPDPSLIRHWLLGQAADAIVRTDAKEWLDSSWLRIVSLPPAIETARILSSTRGVCETEENRRLPWFEHEDRIVGFAKAQELVELMAGSVMLQAANAVDAKTFVEDGSTLGR